MYDWFKDSIDCFFRKKHQKKFLEWIISWIYFIAKIIEVDSLGVSGIYFYFTL